jgi:peptidoglycan/xylan/chitin deacetylase (PgdA/CDA1 family)
MLRSLAKIAVHLDLDNAANRLMDAIYSNTNHASHPLVRRFQVLAYHKVSPDLHPFLEPVHPTVFEQQMQFLSRYYRVMPLLEIVERNLCGDIPDRAVAITFDDGYRDNYEYAFPILKKFGLPATVFIPTGAIDTGEALWHDRIFDAFRYAGVDRASLSHIGLPDVSLEPADVRQRGLMSVLAMGKELYGEIRLRFVEQIEKALKPDYPETVNDRMLTWHQIGEMYQSGIAFGSHTVTHPVLSRIPRHEMVRELCESKRVLSEHLEAPISSFAYPNGHAADYNDEVKSVLRESGYVCAVTCERGFNPVFSDPLEIRRGLPWQKQVELFRFAFFLQRHGLMNS